VPKAYMTVIDPDTVFVTDLDIDIRNDITFTDYGARVNNLVKKYQGNKEKVLADLESDSEYIARRKAAAIKMALPIIETAKKDKSTVYPDLVSKFLTEEQISSLNNTLKDYNGDTFYESVESASAWLPEREFMVVHPDIIKKVTVEDRDKIGTGSTLDANDFVLTAAMNYDKLSHLDAAIRLKVSMIRAEILSRHVVNPDGKAFDVKHDEIIHSSVKPSDDAVKAVAEYLNDNTKETEREYLAILSVIAPIMASIQFVKTGHHFLDNIDYKNAYDRHFKSAVKEDLKNVVPYKYLFHTAVHWMGPNAMWKYAITMKDKGAATDGLSKKLKVAPAGTAVITTSVAVLKAMSVMPFWDEMVKTHGTAIELVQKKSEEIIANPVVYHKRADLFGVTSKLNDEEFVRAFEAARTLSPFTQAFINQLARGSALYEARAIRKHAEENIGVLKLFENALRRYMAENRRTADISQAISLKPSVRATANAPAVEVVEAYEE